MFLHFNSKLIIISPIQDSKKLLRVKNLHLITRTRTSLEHLKLQKKKRARKNTCATALFISYSLDIVVR